MSRVMEIEKNELCGECAAYVEDEWYIKGFGAETWRKETICYTYV